MSREFFIRPEDPMPIDREGGYVPYQEVQLVPRKKPHPVHGPEWDGKNPFGRPGEGTGNPLKLFGIIWYTWDPNDVTDWTQVESSWMKKGFNWQVWLSALTNRIIARGGVPGDEINETSTHVQFKGQAVIDLASMLDTVAFGHWPPGEHVQEVKARSSVGTKVLLWGDWESMSQAPRWSTIHLPLWQYLRGLSSELIGINGCGSGTNGYGCTCIDKYETTDQSGGPCGASYPEGKVACPHRSPHNSLPSEADPGTAHTWDLETYDIATVDDGEILDGWIKAHFDALDGNYRTASDLYTVDGFIYDNVLEAPYKGTAHNDYMVYWTAQKYTDGWKLFLNRMASMAASWDPLSVEDPPVGTWESLGHLLWGNAPIDVGTYTHANLQNRFIEHFFRYGGAAKSLAQSQLDLDAVKASGVNIVLGVNAAPTDVGQTAYWATTTGGPTPSTHGTWQQIIRHIWDLGIEDQIHATAVMTFQDAHIFHQEGWRVPV